MRQFFSYHAWHTGWTRLHYFVAGKAGIDRRRSLCQWTICRRRGRRYWRQRRCWWGWYRGRRNIFRKGGTATAFIDHGGIGLPPNSGLVLSKETFETLRLFMANVLPKVIELNAILDVFGANVSGYLGEVLMVPHKPFVKEVHFIRLPRLLDSVSGNAFGRRRRRYAHRRTRRGQQFILRIAGLFRTTEQRHGILFNVFIRRK